MTTPSSSLITDIEHVREQIYQSFEAMEENNDFSSLFELVEKRDQLIQQVLDVLEGNDKSAFIEQELPINHEIQQKVSALFQQAENQLSKFVRDQKAVKKYK